MKKIILIAIILALIIIQFIPALPANSPELEENNFLAVYETPENVRDILRASCYDCHSNTATWPWYADVAPVNFWLANHVEEGREHLNFSEWATYSDKKRDHKLEEIVEMVEEGEMPLDSYTWMHDGAELNAEEREALISFVQGLRN